MHAAATFMMTGIAWFVQIVHYPLFSLVGPATFDQYESANISRTSFVVVPLMVGELASALWLARKRPRRPVPVWIGLALLGAIWASTFTLQLPMHKLLIFGFNEDVFRSLLASNWIRTIAWSSRSILAAKLLLDE